LDRAAGFPQADRRPVCGQSVEVFGGPFFHAFAPPARTPIRSITHSVNGCKNGIYPARETFPQHLILDIILSSLITY
jgi:hypothetical protein